MAITTLDGLLSALANNSSRVVIDKASLGNAVAGQLFSLWRAIRQSVAACYDTLTLPNNARADSARVEP